MENATKALIVAGAILIAIIIISLGVTVFQQTSETTEKMIDMTEQEVGQFNSKITPYIGQNISGSQVNALIQYIRALDLNEETLNVTITFPPNSKLSGDGFEGTAQKVETGKFYSVIETERYSNGAIKEIKVEAN